MGIPPQRENTNQWDFSTNAEESVLKNDLLVFVNGVCFHEGVPCSIMGLTIDDVMEKIGSYSRYQHRLLLICGFMKIFGDGFQIMIPTFLSAEPPWRCKENSSACNLTGIFKPGDKNYTFRCSIPRDEWEFDTSQFNSVVAEVKFIFLSPRAFDLKSPVHPIFADPRTTKVQFCRNHSFKERLQYKTASRGLRKNWLMTCNSLLSWTSAALLRFSLELSYDNPTSRHGSYLALILSTDFLCSGTWCATYRRCQSWPELSCSWATWLAFLLEVLYLTNSGANLSCTSFLCCAIF